MCGSHSSRILRLYRPVRIEIDADTDENLTTFLHAEDWIPFSSEAALGGLGSVQQLDGFVSIETLWPMAYMLVKVDGQACSYETEYQVCGPDAFCNELFVCEPLVCGTTDDCGDGKVCQDRTCQVPCDVGAECGPAEFCVEGGCTMIECEPDAGMCEAYEAICITEDEFFSFCAPEGDDGWTWDEPETQPESL